MPGNILAGTFANVLGRGGLSRAVGLLQRAMLGRLPTQSLFREVFVDFTPTELRAMINAAQNALAAGERLTVFPLRRSSRAAVEAPLGIPGIGPFAGVGGRVTIIVENPFGGDDIWILRNLTGDETLRQLTRDALREAAKVVSGSPGRFTPTRDQPLTELGALRLLNRDAEVTIRDVFFFQ